MLEDPLRDRVDVFLCTIALAGTAAQVEEAVAMARKLQPIALEAHRSDLVRMMRSAVEFHLVRFRGASLNTSS